MVQLILADFLKQFAKVYAIVAHYPEVALLGGIVAFLLFRGKLKSALILLFGAALCLANYFIFVEYSSLTIPITYAVGFAGVSVFLLLLLVYQLIHIS